jgi:hypothetical protein
MKKGKTADVFELTVENILYGGDELLYIIHKIFGYFAFHSLLHCQYADLIYNHGLTVFVCLLAHGRFYYLSF